MWPETSVSRVLGGIYLSSSHSWNYTPVQLGVFSMKSLLTACEVSTVFIVVVSTQKWPENIDPGSQDA